MMWKSAFSVLLSLTVAACGLPRSLHAEDPDSLIGHAEPAYAGVYSPNSSQLITTSFDKTLRIWDLKSGTTLRSLTGHTAMVLCVCVSPDGTRLASGSLDNTVRLWDLPTSLPAASFQPHPAATVFAMSADGSQWITAGADRTLKIWRAADQQLIREIGPLPHPITRIAIRPDNQQFATADEAGFAQLIQPSDGAVQATFGAHDTGITGIGYVANSSVIVTTGAEGSIKHWPLAIPASTVATNYPEPVLVVRTHPQQPIVATGSADKTCRLWNSDTRQVLGTLEGHQGAVTSLCFQSDGARIATGSADKVTRLFDVQTGRLVKSYSEQAAAITSVAIHPNQLDIAAADASGAIKVWNIETASELRSIAGHVGGTFAIAYGANPTLLVSGGADRHVRIWNATDGSAIRELDATAIVRAVAVSRDGQHVAAGGDDHKIRIWNLNDGNLIATCTGHSKAVTSLEFSRNNLMLVSSSLDGTVRGWNAKHGLQTQFFAAPMREPVQGADWSKDDQQIVYAGNDGALYWNPYRIQSVHAGDPTSINAFAAHPASNQYFTAGQDGSVKLWDATNATLIREFKGHTGAVRSLALAPNQQQIASGGVDQKVKLWNVADASKPQREMATGAEVRQITYSPDQKKLIAAGDDRIIRGYDLTTGSTPASAGLPEAAQVTLPLPAAISSLVIAPDNRTAFSSSTDGAVQRWAIASAQFTLAIPGHQSHIYGVAFHPSEPWIASSSNDKTVRIWDYEKNVLVRMLPSQAGAVYSLAFTPDGSQLITAGGDATVKSFRTADGTQLRQFNGPREAVYSVALSPDGQTLAAAGLDRTVFLWKIDNPNLFKTLPRQPDDIYKVEYDRSGHSLISVGYSGTVIVWNENQKEPQFHQKLGSTLYSGTISPSGDQAAIMSSDGKVHLLKLPTNPQP